MRAYVLALFLCGCGVAAEAPAPARPDWLSGYWLSCEGGETAENWIGAGGRALLGTNLSAGGFEFLRIAENDRGGFSYYSMPDGAPVTEFAMISHERQRVVFENPSHDFPQRVIYERDGDALHARIEGMTEGREQHVDWSFRRSRPDTRCPR